MFGVQCSGKNWNEEFRESSRKTEDGAVLVEYDFFNRLLTGCVNAPAPFCS